jgi:hypothetical protein
VKRAPTDLAHRRPASDGRHPEGSGVMETYIIKCYAEVEWNEQQAAERHRRSGDQDRPGLIKRVITRVLQMTRTAGEAGRRAAHLHTAPDRR